VAGCAQQSHGCHSPHLHQLGSWRPCALGPPPCQPAAHLLWPHAFNVGVVVDLLWWVPTELLQAIRERQQRRHGLPVHPLQAWAEALGGEDAGLHLPLLPRAGGAQQAAQPGAVACSLRGRGARQQQQSCHHGPKGCIRSSCCQAPQEQAGVANRELQLGGQLSAHRDASDQAGLLNMRTEHGLHMGCNPGLQSWPAAMVVCQAGTKKETQGCWCCARCCCRSMARVGIYAN